MYTYNRNLQTGFQFYTQISTQMVLYNNNNNDFATSKCTPSYLHTSPNFLFSATGCFIFHIEASSDERCNTTFSGFRISFSLKFTHATVYTLMHCFSLLFVCDSFDIYVGALLTDNNQSRSLLRPLL